MPLRAVLFDAAGTLFRVRGSVGAVYAREAARHGVRLTPEEIERRFRAVFPTARPMCFPDAAEADLPAREYAWWRDLVERVFADATFDDFDACFRALFEHFAHAEAWELYPDTVPTLQALRGRGLRLAVVSNFDGRLIPVCDGLGLTPLFDTIVMSGRAGWAKPDPRIFALALARLGVAPTEALHIGDSAREDVGGATAAGIPALRIDRHGPGPDAAETITGLATLLDRV